MESSAIILTVIGDKFKKNNTLEFELYLAQMLVHENLNKLLIPVALNNAEVPVELEKVLYIPCETESEEDLNKVRGTYYYRRLLAEHVLKREYFFALYKNGFMLSLF